MNKLLIVVDFQNDFVNGSLGFPDALLLEDKICQKIIEYKAQGQSVIFTMDTHEPDYLTSREGLVLPVVHCVRGSLGHQLYGRVEDLSAGCEKLEKTTFGSDLLFYYLQKHPFDQIELVGLVSNICVLSNAVIAQAALPEAQIIVDASCTSSFDKNLNNKTLDILSGLQVQVINY